MQSLSLLCLPLLLLFNTAIANEPKSSQQFGDYVIHYSSFNSTFVTPDVAKIYALTRDKRTGLVNIAVHYKGKPIPAQLEGETANLLQQKEALTFRLIDEEEAIYYLAPFHFINEEVLHVTVTVTPEQGGSPMTVRFSRTFYEG
ncbi:MAG: DUF4426 domain-containing protein [Endozoicomonadaceae bacterium]|nr:DUF4426 domain-containing protein [Endozoicomonadaceae bacterium]